MTVAPRDITLTVVKPASFERSFYVINQNEERLNASMTLDPGDLPDAFDYITLVSISPATVALDPGQLLELVVACSTTAGLPARGIGFEVRIAAETPKSLPTNTSVPVSLTIEAQADPSASNASVLCPPTLGSEWHGVEIAPYDYDGLRITTDDAEAFELSLSSKLGADVGVASCNVAWQPSPITFASCGTTRPAVYLGLCDGITGFAGEWIAEVTLDGSSVMNQTVRMQCPIGTYETSGAACEECPAGTQCESAGISIRSLVLSPGWWRSSETSTDARPCPLGAAACPGSTGADQGYCAQGYVGPLCDSVSVRSCMKNARG